MRKILLPVVFSLGVLILGGTARADTIVFQDYTKFAGTPELPTFSATIEDTTTGVTITMDHPVSTDSDIVFSWFFNIVPPIPAGLSASSFAFVSGVEATGQNPTPGIHVGEDIQQADGDGKFDIVFTWPNSGTGEFLEGLNSIYTVTGIQAADFLALSTTVGGQHGPYYSAVEQSAWWGQGTNPTPPTPPIPEPSTLILLGSGIAGMGIASRRFLKR